MATSREFDFREAYPGISNENISVIQKYYDSKSKSITSYQTFRCFNSIVNTMCSSLQANDYIPFKQWDATVFKSFIRSTGYTGSALVRSIPYIKEIVAASGCTNDLSPVTITSLVSEYCSPLLSFEIMNNIMKKVFQEERSQYTWNAINSWSAGVVISYLLWMGFIRDEIVHLRRDDFDEKTGTITYRCSDYTKQRTISERINKEAETYIRNYFNCKSYEVYSEYGGWRNIPFVDGDTFIKLTSSDSSKMKDNIDNYTKKMKRVFGFGSPEILTAGRMNRLYYLNKFLNIPITIKYADEIGNDLGLPIPARVKYTTELGSLIYMYDSYREKREALYSNV